MNTEPVRMSYRQSKSSDLRRSVLRATWWSALTQISGKIITPVTTMILARMLTPESFGIVALSTMVISFAGLLTNAGFQKYLVQENFTSKTEELKYVSVAFWANFTLATIICIAIFLVRDHIAVFIGASGYGRMLAVSAISIPIATLSSTQIALCQKYFKFRIIFYCQLIGSIVSLVVSVVLAYLQYDYWSIIVASLVSQIVIAVLLTIFSRWIPRFFFSFKYLHRMLSYGIWIYIESVAIWFNTWTGTLIISHLLSKQYVGYYNTSTSTAANIVSLVTATIMPVAFSSFSKVKSDYDRLKAAFLQAQRYLALLLIPLAVGCFVYRKAITDILLGSQWQEVQLLFGLWMLAGCISIAFGNLCSEAYRAVGKPKYCVLVQVLYLIPFVPTLYWGASKSFTFFSVIVPMGRLTLPLIQVIVMKYALGIYPKEMMSNLKYFYVAALVATSPGVLLLFKNIGVIGQLALGCLSASIYIAVLYCTSETRTLLLDLLLMIRRRSENHGSNKNR